MVTERADVEPILPMGQLVHDLGCKVCWKTGDLKILHPRRGLLPVQNQKGCPQLPRALAWHLIEEMEVVGSQRTMRSLKLEKEQK